MSKEEIEYHKILNRLVIIKNCISLICFTTLAIIFNKWWIVFFSVLFTSYIDKGEEKNNE